MGPGQDGERGGHDRRIRCGRRRSAVAAILALASLWPSLAAAAPRTTQREAIWIFFRDHGPAVSTAEGRAAVLARAARDVSPRALARRAKRGSGAVDERDLEPADSYVAAVIAEGVVLRTRSRWLNAVSADVPPDRPDRIRALPFVRETAPVAIGAPDGPPAADASGADAPAGAEAADAFSYGPAYRQLEMLGVGEAHAMGHHGEGVLVCVLDTGFDLEHEAFRHLDVVGTRDFLNRDEDVGWNPRTDRPGQSNHGTQVLSVLAGYAPGRLVGPAYRAAFLLGKTERSGAEQPVEEDFWCEGVEWAERMGADIVTSSLSYPSFYHRRDMDGRTAVATRAASLAWERGLLLVNSVGNAGRGGGHLGAPTDAPGVISVGAVTAEGEVAAFSTRGPTWDQRVKPDLTAMGVGVVTVRTPSRDRYGRANGTSYSAPLVAGIAALVLSAHPDWSPEAVRDALLWSADRAARPDNAFGWGVPNARDAILYPYIEGRVLDADTGEPIAGARVAWERAGEAVGAEAIGGEAITDSTGSYVAANLPAGTYRLRASAEGYEPGDSGAPIELPPSLGDVNLTLRLRR